MRKIITSVLLLAFVSVFAACDPPTKGPEKPSGITDDTVSGTITDMPSGTGYIVKLVGDDGELLASSPVSANGSFSIELPATLDPEYFEPFFEDLEEGITVTGADVMVVLPGTIMLELYRGDEYIDDLLFGKYNISETSISVVGGTLCYSEGDATAKGSFSETDDEDPDLLYEFIVDVSLKKGWNWVFVATEIDIAAKKIVERQHTTIPGGSYFYLSSAVDDVW